MKNNSTIEIPLSGVESEHCALIVDKGLGKVEGIGSHKVETNNKRAVINTNGDFCVAGCFHSFPDVHSNDEFFISVQKNRSKEKLFR